MLSRLLIVVSFFCISCGSDTLVSETSELGYDYFPLADMDNATEYIIKETTYANNGLDVNSNQYYQREVVAEQEGSRDALAINRIDIYRKKDLMDLWEYSHSEKVEMDALQVITESNGERIVNLTFPVAEDKRWEGLAFVNTSIPKVIAGENIYFYKDWDFVISGVNQTYESYDDVLVVTEADSENAIEKRYSVSKYAKGVGLVHRERIILDTQCLQECVGQSWLEKAHKGMVYTKELIN